MVAIFDSRGLYDKEIKITDSIIKVGVVFTPTFIIESVFHMHLPHGHTHVDVPKNIMNSYGKNPKSQFLRTSNIDRIPL